ncbi:glutamine-hydrolyzing GMP synthase [Desulforhopalus singaporensis]|uniref:GMP synthase [glutamine-hydrolyzing] n=1 Tax=Desulforhopalus singaporensis TaxID=91360 RepID=A0A1H0Q9L8_9BACT|nr:glutamine-hydrolyzing GMP synthase [Desulforhopalus singaporensis]SDP14082.1 GMP synthase (glutamine-hydrolyzing) [Desulforhopalus singaporensis]
MDIHSEKIIILDFGSQTTQLIARRIREQKVYSEIHPFSISLDKIKELKPSGIVLSGGPCSVYDADAPHSDPGIFELDIPVLGICYGAQLMLQQMGGKVEKAEKREFGKAELTIHYTAGLFAGLETDKPIHQVWMSHGDRVEEIPEGFAVTATSVNSPNAALRHKTKPFVAVQFHPEVAHTVIGNDVLRNFIFGICNCSPEWTMHSFIEQNVRAIKKKVGSDKVICALSGGVDSSVVAAIIHRAIGDQLTCIYVNNGLMRTGESESIMRFFKEKTKLKLIDINATDFFLGELDGVEDPEVKRKRIGLGFIKIFEEEAGKIGGVKYLAQGTLYPDVIESVSFRGEAPIKSHHNVGGLPEVMQLDLIEPLRELFKDEVRELGLELGLPEEAIYRQPFPGPGLGIRIMGEVTAERLNILRQSDVIVLEEMRRAGWYRKVWQSFAVLLPIQTVGVMGDGRTYEHVIAIRSVDSRDAMTADWSKLPYEILGEISSRIINEVRGVNRVVYDISSKPPATIEWE